MSNVGKHLFSVNHYGCSYCGAIQAETEKTFTVKHPYWSGTNRINKKEAAVLLAADTDPQKAGLAFRATWHSFADELAAAEAALASIKQRRKEAATAALQSDPTPPQTGGK